MKCRICKDSEMLESQENYHYRECGMDNVSIMGIAVRRCPTCGVIMPVIPNIEGLHDALANTIIKKDGPLTPPEIVFLRKSLGWSGTDFAKNMNCDKAQISKWEHGTVKMSKPYELLLREIVAIGKKITDYHREEIVWKRHPSRQLLFRLKRTVWREAA
jgi:putative zinc finger/helix-turn-helix YgiT family protein